MIEPDILDSQAVIAVLINDSFFAEQPERCPGKMLERSVILDAEDAYRCVVDDFF